MNWINLYGLAFTLALMIPSIISALANKAGFQNLWDNKAVLILEQIGRYGCIAFMILILPGSSFGFSSNEAFAVYLLLNTGLISVYCLLFIVCFRRKGVFKALALSILPSLLFLASGALSRYLPLLLSALVFAPCHIAVSYKNAVLRTKGEDNL